LAPVMSTTKGGAGTTCDVHRKGKEGLKRQTSFMSAEDWVNSLPQPVFTSDTEKLNELVKSLGNDLDRVDLAQVESD